VFILMVTELGGCRHFNAENRPSSVRKNGWEKVWGIYAVLKLFGGNGRGVIVKKIIAATTFRSGY
jgi:hypothetical protein